MKTAHAHLRATLFKKRYSRKQREGVELLMWHFWDRYPGKDPRWLANILAQVYHETGGTMQPVRETFATSDRQAIRRLDSAYQRGDLRGVKKPYWSDGFFGRGHIQLTHRRNYTKMGRVLGIDLVNNPTLALRPDISAAIAVVGMVEGLFTGRSLGLYFSSKHNRVITARAVVNGFTKDRRVARKIAGYHAEFLTAVKSVSNKPTRTTTKYVEGPGVAEGIAVGGGGGYMVNCSDKDPVQIAYVVTAVALTAAVLVVYRNRKTLRPYLNEKRLDLIAYLEGLT